MKRITLQLNLTEFLKTGTFGFINLGLTKAELESQLFPPEDWMERTKAHDKDNTPIWRYGNFELHFDEKQQVRCIFNDYVPHLDGGESIQITDWWIIEPEVNSPTVLQALKSLNTLNLDFEKVTGQFDNVTFRLQSGVRLIFHPPEELSPKDVNQYTLTAITKSAD